MIDIEQLIFNTIAEAARKFKLKRSEIYKNKHDEYLFKILING